MGKGIITIIGSSSAGEEELKSAEICGKLVAQSGFVLMTGGRGGVMEAAARGCASAEGTSIGLLPDMDTGRSNPFNTIELPSGIGFARNLPNVLAGHGIIVIGGSVGTLTELGYALQFRKPIFLVSFLSGVSHVPAEFLAEIAPWGDLKRCESFSNLTGELDSWLHLVHEKIQSDQTAKS